LAAIVLGSWIPGSWKVRLRTNGSFHFPLHVTVFFIAGFLRFRVTPQPVRRWVNLAGLVALAILLEMVEARLGRNAVEWRDVVADLAGLAVALAVPACKQGRPLKPQAVAGKAARRF